MCCGYGWLDGTTLVQLLFCVSRADYRRVKKRITMRDQNYQELVRKVTMYLDNELSESDERELLIEIKANPAYLKVLSQEKSFREFIKSKIHRRKPSPALIQSIKDKIRVTTV
jgi:phage tail sheath gpL-like